ncbi:hypothetical protein CUR178_00254 [Leishmania enriettii]|uniref:Cullin neddylation domain-containing protein n=1 Tax=Leishmania enriettii TaxID=5663 RepID=A0A836G543_LEIEN|nr:hypothetical protein CUR178_00254 [Leishmania enriettii]
MTVSLHDVIKEWEVVNAGLWRASQESHRRYPFPANSDGGLADIDRAAEATSSSSSPLSSTAMYARVYNLLSRVLLVAEDAHYNSFYIIQHLLWVTIVAWANQLANASRGLIQLPIGMRQYHEPPPSCTTRGGGAKGSGNGNDTADKSVSSASSPVQRTSFSCALLPQLEFWPPNVLGETTVTAPCEPDNLRSASTRRSPSLPEVWSDAVQRIFALWCDTPTTGSSAEAAQPCSTQGASATTAPAAVQYAHVWVIVAQHYHRFKSLLSLFFLRYDALLEDAEEELQRRGRQQQQHRRCSDFRGGKVQRAGTNSPQLPPFPLRRRSDPLHPLFLSTTAPTAPLTGEESALHTNKQARVSPRPRPSVPSTASLLGHLMQSIANENLRKIHEAIGGALLFLLLPRVYRARLRHQNTAHVSGAESHTSWSDYAPPQGSTGTEKGNTSKETPWALITLPKVSDPPDWQCSAYGDDEGEDDDHVVWSSPPSPLLSYRAVSVPHGNGDAPAPADRAGAPCTACRVGGRAQQEEYVLRHIFKVLLMIEDCRLHALQRWLVEDSKRVASFYGCQLAANLFDDAAGQPAAFFNEHPSCSPSGAAITTARTLADANRVLRETLQAYVRLRAKLLFLNAGTTHFLDALTPWGRTRMLESLNAFLCGFSGAFVPSPLPSDGEVLGRSTAGSPNQKPNQSVTSLHDGYDELALFTPANPGVADFAQRWGVPLWVAMCDDTQQRMEALKHEEEKRAKRPKRCMAPAEEECGHTKQLAQRQRQQPHAIGERLDGETSEKDRWSSSRGDTSAPSAPFTPSFTPAARNAGDDGRTNKLDARDRHSVASTELEDAVSRTASVVWPPSSPTAADAGGGGGGDGIRRHRGVDKAGQPFTRRRGRGLDLKRVLHQQQQRRARLGDVKLPQRGVTASRMGAPVAGSEDGGGDAVESLYTGETASVGDDGSLLAAAVETGNNGGGVGRLPGNTGAPTTEVGQRGGGQGPAISSSSPAKRFSRSAQLHQVATLPDEGFPCLLYLMPRRSRFAMQDKAAAAVQQQLLTRFSASVQAYLTDYLTEFETAAAASADHRVASASPKIKREKAAQVIVVRENAGTSTLGAPLIDIVTPLPQPVVARMAFLLEMTYAALQGRGGAASDSLDDHTEDHNGSGNGASLRPLMETGLTATGQELGAAILEHYNGEFDSAVSTALSTPTSPALLAIAAVRKGFQGFLTSLEKRAVLALAKALYDHVQQGAAKQPPAAQLDAVDTILNMASLLNSKDMFVLLLKGYLASKVMMCRSPSELVVESQVVSRMVYRLGAAVAAPCLTLLRDLQLAMSDPRSAATLLPPFSGHADLAEDWELNAAYENFSGGGRRSDCGEFRGASSASMAAECVQLAATRDAEMSASVGSSYHGVFGLIHRLRVLCQAWWQPHTTVLLSSRRLRQLWERHHLLDERIVDAVLSVEWQYQGHSEPYGGYGELARLRESEDSNHSPPSRSGGGGPKSSRGGLNDAPEGARWRRGSGGQHTGSLSAGTQLRTVAAAAVVRGFSSALGNAVRRTGRQTGDFGYHDSDNESEDYREAYGGLLTLSTLQQHRSAYAPSSSSHRGSNLSSVGSPGGVGGAGAGGEHWGTSDGRQSTIADDRASTAVPADGQLERRQLRWPLGNGQLAFYLFPRGTCSTEHSISQAVQIFGPPITLLVCQLLDRAREQPYTFDALHKALPVQAPKPLLAHLLHELVKADVVVRSVAAGTRQLTYQLRDDTREARQRKVVVDVRAAAQQKWVAQVMTMADADAADDGQDDSPERDRAREPASPANPTKAAIFFPKSSPDPAQKVHINASTKAKASPSALVDEPSSLTYSTDRAHKIKVCIVRVMKAERVLSHRELAERVALALEDQFVVTPGQFKSCVAHLIEKEFLQRGEQGEYMFVS